MQLPPFLEAVINQFPAAVAVRGDFTFAVIGAAAGAADKALGAGGEGADTAGMVQEALAALVTAFRTFPFAAGAAQINGITGRINGLVNRRGDTLHADTAGHDENRIGGFKLVDFAFQFRLDEGFTAEKIDSLGAGDFFPGFRQLLLHFLDLLWPSAARGLGASFAAHDEYIFVFFQISDYFIERFLL